MRDVVVDKALAHWRLDGARADLVAARENAVFRVETEDGAFALRLHRVGYRSEAELASELLWMRAAVDAGVDAPRPIPAPDGAALAMIDGVAVDLLSWLDGAPMGRNGDLVMRDGVEERARDLGVAMARLHVASDAWTPPPGFARPRWDRAGLLGEAPLWGRFWDNPRLTRAERALLTETRRAADARLAAVEDALDVGLIHADLIPDNVIIRGDGVALLDFDDGGSGFRLFDLATSLNRLEESDRGAALSAALLDGYRSVRAIDLAELPLFQTIRALSYVGWIADRLSEPGAEARSARAIARAVARAQRFLERI